MNKRNLAGLLGMCRRAGRLTTGFDAVIALCNEPQALLLVAENASPRTVKELRFRAKEHPLYAIPLTKEEIADAVGSQKPIAVLATADVGFADALRTYVIGGIPL